MNDAAAAIQELERLRPRLGRLVPKHFLPSTTIIGRGADGWAFAAPGGVFKFTRNQNEAMFAAACLKAGHHHGIAKHFGSLAFSGEGLYAVWRERVEPTAPDAATRRALKQVDSRTPRAYRGDTQPFLEAASALPCKYLREALIHYAGHGIILGDLVRNVGKRGDDVVLFDVGGARFVGPKPTVKSA